MKFNVFKSLIYILLLLPSYAKSQSATDLELHNRYWTYRENFRKYFTKLGILEGNGLPFSHIESSFKAEYQKTDGIGVDIDNETVKLFGRLNPGGDLTAYLGDYLGVLTSEYWLLRNEGIGKTEEMKAVLNEIYFAVYAVERLDKYSKRYFTKGPTDNNADGFFQEMIQIL